MTVSSEPSSLPPETIMSTRQLSRIFAAAAAFTLAVAPAAQACTGIKLVNKDGTTVHGRTVEFGTKIDINIAAIPRGTEFKGRAPGGDGLKYTSKYAAVGAVTFKDMALADGLNEAGLATGIFYFPGFAQYAQVTDQNRSKALSPVDFTNWVLTQFATVAEVKSAIEAGQAIIAPTVLDGWGPEPPPFHYVVYDKSGASIVIEPVGGTLKIHDNPLGVVTNSPTFDWHMTNLRNYISLRPRNVASVKIGPVELTPLGQGSGMVGMPGDFTPPSRFVRAAIYSATAVPSANAEEGITQTFHILNNFDIPKGVAGEKRGSEVGYDYTLYTVARDPQNLRYYWRTYEDQTIRMVDMKALGLAEPSLAISGTPKVKLLSVATTQPIVDMTSQMAAPK
jgi:choloylglycine hydrolase